MRSRFDSQFCDFAKLFIANIRFRRCTSPHNSHICVVSSREVSVYHFIERIVKMVSRLVHLVIMTILFVTVESSKGQEEDYQEEGPKGHFKHLCHVRSGPDTRI